MKKISAFVLLSCAFLLMSCEKEPYFNVGFDATITNNSNGSVVAELSDQVEIIYLNGSIAVEEGEVEISLLSPGGVEMYKKIAIAPVVLNIDESFEAEPGEWNLKYESREGIGDIDLHIHI